MDMMLAGGIVILTIVSFGGGGWAMAKVLKRNKNNNPSA